MHKRSTDMIVVDETDVLRNLEKKTYSLVVRAGAADFKATLVYADKEAAVPATIHRVNNLDLKVTAPDGTVYWGNNGLKAGMTSTPGGEHNVLDTVENVIVQNPQAGRWTIDVIADGSTPTPTSRPPAPTPTTRWSSAPARTDAPIREGAVSSGA